MPIVTFTNASQLYVCLGATCGGEVAKRTSITVAERPAEAKPAVDGGLNDTRGPGTVTVRYDTSAEPAPATGAVLRLRYPASPAGAWTIDVSMRAEVTPATECAPAYGTLNPEKARRIMLQQVESCIEAKDYLRLSAAYTLLLSIHQDAGNMDSAGAYLSKLSELASSIPDLPKVQGNCNQAIGLYYNKKGDYKAALPYALNAVKYAELGSSSDKAYIGGQWLNAADVYSGLGQYNNAMNCYLKSLRLFEESGSKRGEGFCYTNMATLYNSIKQYSNALRSAQKSLEIKTELRDNLRSPPPRKAPERGGVMARAPRERGPRGL